MKTPDVSRRAFALVAGGLAAGIAPICAAGGPSAKTVVAQIRERLGGEWADTGLDGFKAGSPETGVRGIATTAIATIEVLRQAAKAGLNLVVTYEPTFFGIRDGAAPAPANDPVLQAKRDFI